MAQEELSILVRMRDNATKEFAGLKSVVGGTVKALFSLKGAIGALAFGYTAKKIADLVIGTAAWGDRIQKLSLRLGVSTEALSELAFAAERSGTSIDDLETALRTGTKNFGEFAATGVGEARDAIKLLGPDIEHLVLRGEKLENLLPLISQGFQKLGETDRVFVASKLFGRSGTNLIPLLTSDMEGLRKRARELGLTLSQDAANDAADFTDALTDLKSAFQGLKQSIIFDSLQIGTRVLKELTDQIIKNRPAILRGVADVVEGLGSLQPVLAETAINLDRLLRIGSSPSKIGAVVGLELIEDLAQGLEKVTGGIIKSTYKAGDAAHNLIENDPKLKERAEAIRAFAQEMERIARETAERLREHAGEAKKAKDELDDLLDFDPGEDRQPENYEVINAGLRTNIELLKEKYEQEERLAALASLSTAQKDREYIADLKRKKAIEEQRDAVKGLTAQLDRWADESKNLGDVAGKALRGIEDAIAGNFSDAMLALISGTKSAKDAFKEMAVSMLNDIARIIMQESIRLAIHSAFSALGFGVAGAAKGGVFGGHFEPVRGHMAGGGVLTQRGLYELVEGGKNEAVVPLPDNRSIPVKILGGGGSMGGAPLNFYYQPVYYDPGQEARILEKNHRTVEKIVLDAMDRSRIFRQRMSA